MARAFAGKIQLDVRDSVVDWDAFEIAKVVFDIADDAYVDVQSHLAAAMARD